MHYLIAYPHYLTCINYSIVFLISPPRNDTTSLFRWSKEFREKVDTQGLEPYLPLCKRGAFPIKLTAQSVVESVIFPHFRCVLSLHLDL